MMPDHPHDDACCAACVEIKGDGRFEGYASLFNLRDRSGDVVRPGAFAKSLRARGAAGIRFLHQHKPEEPLGVWEEVREDGRGLFVRGRFILESARANEAWALVARGALDGLSIGYKTVRAGKSAQPKGRALFEIDLWEISLVTFPLLVGARITRVGEGRVGDEGSGETLTTALRQAARHISL